MKNFFRSVFLQFSGIVGAGIFALPFIFYKSNFGFMAIILIVVGIITLVINLFYIEIITKTEGDHQLSGYAEIYLGKSWKIVSLASLIFLCLGGILAFIKLASTFLTVFWVSIPIWAAAIIFIVLAGFLHLIRFRLSKTIVQSLWIFNLLIILIIFGVAWRIGNINLNINQPNIYGLGVIVFAMSGFTIIPEMEEVLRREKNKKIWLKISSATGLVLAMVVYLAFCYGVIVISGGQVSDNAVSGVLRQNILCGYVLVLFGFTTVLMATLNLMLVLKEIFHQDLKMKNKISYLISILFLFMTLFFINIPFIEIISWVGTISIVISTIIICLIRFKIKK